MLKKVLQVGVLLVSLVLIVLYGLRYNLYGNRKIVVFPFEMVKDLPEEPNWYEENVFDDILQYQREQREIQKWFDNVSFKGINIVNKSGDPIPLKTFELGSMFGVTFFQNDGSLVVVSSECGSGGLRRMRVLENSMENEQKRYCCSLKTIIDEWDGSYIDYNKNLYYYINDGEPKIQKMDEQVEKVDGHYLYECTSYPILLKDGQLYTYILEGAEWTLPGDYGYYVEEIKIKKIILTELQGICKIEKQTETRARLKSSSILPREMESFSILLEGDGLKEVKESEYDLGEGLSILQKEEVFVVIEEFSNTQENWIPLDRSSGYDDRWLW